jgi:predicted  nucleic acid-binding Zn-ribbon protein
MSPIGKVFTVVNLVLAALFVGSAAALIQTGQDWRVQYEASDQAFKDLEASSNSALAKAVAEKQQEENAKNGFAAEKAQLESDKAALEDELNTQREQNADLRERLTSIDGKLGDLESTNRSQQSQITTLNENATALRSERDEALDARDEAEAARAGAERNATSFERERDELQIALGRANEAVASKSAQLAAVASQYKIDLNNLNDQPELAGRVTAVDSTHGTTVVVINLGKNDGVKPGHTFDVYAGGEYKGKIYVETVNASQSAATIQMAGIGEIAVNDAVVTRL